MNTLKRYAHALGHDFESRARGGLRVPEVSKDYSPLLLDIIKLAQKIGVYKRELYASSVLTDIKDGGTRQYYGLDKLRKDFDTLSLGLSLVLHDRESLTRELQTEKHRNLGSEELNQGHSKRDEEIDKRNNEINELKARVKRLKKENDALLDSRRGNNWLGEQIGFEEIIPLIK